MLRKLSHQLAGDLGEQLALAKFISLGFAAYTSPPGAPGHDLMIATPDGAKSIEVKTRQFLSRPSEIGRWPVDMRTKGDADYFLFVELDLSNLAPTFYLLTNSQAHAIHKDYNGTGNCPPHLVRETSVPNDFSALHR